MTSETGLWVLLIGVGIPVIVGIGILLEKVGLKKPGEWAKRPPFFSHFPPPSARDTPFRPDDPPYPSGVDCWVWREDPGAVDEAWARSFEQWIQEAENKDQEGYYTETIPVLGDGRLSPDKRVNGDMSWLPVCFSQINVGSKVRETVPTRGPTLEEFYLLLNRLMEMMPGFHFIVDEDPDRKWIRYRVKRGLRR